MSIPDYQSLMLPLLEYARDENEHSLREAIDALADRFSLTEQERKDLLPSGQQAIFDNRVGWARTYLKKSLLLETPRRGYLRITERGLGTLQQGLQKIDSAFLQTFKEFREFKALRHDKSTDATGSEEQQESTPEEALENAYLDLRDNLATDLLQRIKGSPPSLFEKIVVELLVKMGYGGSRRDAGQAIGKSGDEGIDGIIKEDRLGLDIIYVHSHPIGAQNAP